MARPDGKIVTALRLCLFLSGRLFHGLEVCFASINGQHEFNQLARYRQRSAVSVATSQLFFMK